MLNQILSIIFLLCNQQLRKGLFGLFLLGLCLIPIHLFAGGFQINLQGSKNSSMGNTGAGSALDNASIFFNPGALVFSGRAAINVYGAAIIPSVTYRALPPNYDKVNAITKVGTPFSVFTHFTCKSCGDSSKWALGAGIYTAYGSALQWPKHWQGQYMANSVKLKTVFFQPTLSWRLSNKFSFGFGAIIANGSFAFNKSLPITGLEIPEINLSAKAKGFGLSMGTYFAMNRRLAFGATLKTPIKLKLFNGKASFTHIPTSIKDSFPSTSFTSSLTLPATLQVGTSYMASHKWLFLMDVLFTSWSMYDTIIYDFTHNTNLLTDTRSSKYFKNTASFKFGAQYTYSPFKKYRLGVVLDPTPANAHFTGPESPDNSKLSLSAGYSYQVAKRAWIEFNSLFIMGKRFYFNNLETGFNGSFKINALVFGIGFYNNF